MKMTNENELFDWKQILMFYDKQASVDFLMNEINKQKLITNLETKELEELYGEPS